ncbi:MAG: methyltransferase [Candidatus Saccharibacteria bacterium]|nr:methyltransferase [Candidatus Saccharibacteria bacterium]
MPITFSQAQRNVTELANRTTYSKDVVFELLAAFGRSASAIAKLRNGTNNLATDQANEVLQRGVVYFKQTQQSGLLLDIEKLEQDPLTVRYNPRYLIVTDYRQLVAKDTKKGSTLDIKIQDIDRHVDFFYGWTGNEVTSERTEAVADRRAADKMKELYYEVADVNRQKFAVPGNNFRHDLNVFFTRLLFCFFAEDTRVFSKTDANIFTDAIRDFTQLDGSDLNEFLETLFMALDSKEKGQFSSPFSNFPYVNGSLFDTKRDFTVPDFNAQARKLIIDCGSLDWSKISPDIFGSMFQSIVEEERRAAHGMHYTSVPNIMKTIEPLFLNELRDEFDKYYDNVPRLIKLYDRIAKIKVFDPACGSGNFLIIAYKELRKLEHGIIEQIIEQRGALEGLKLTSSINLDNFYGIEIDDFAHEIAILSLYLVKHQMNIEFQKQFGKEIELIPLKDKANIILGNAARLDWQDVCPNIARSGSTSLEQGQLIEDDYQQAVLLNEQDTKQWDEIYLIGNPPYQGGKTIKEASMKEDVKRAFAGSSYSKNIDYISIWFLQGARYIAGSKAKLAFVSTNSICQGEQVSMLWPRVFKLGLEIQFAYTSFKWKNSAKDNAGVTCVIVCLGAVSPNKKLLFTDNVGASVEHINAYLIASSNDTIVTKRSSPLSDLPKIALGSMPKDGGGLVLTKQEYLDAVNADPAVEHYIKKFVGSDNFIKGVDRYCLWITPDQYNEAKQVPFIAERLEMVRKYRSDSDAESTVAYASKPYRFIQISYQNTDSIIIPRISSERRVYIPVGYLDKNSVVSDGANVIYNAEPSIFGLMSSLMHNVWVKAVSGGLETRINYSSTLCYNNFPVPTLSQQDKQQLTAQARGVLFARENHSEKSLAEMYDPDKMPEDLRQAHHELDLVVDQLYRSKPYEHNEARLADLFTLYEQMTLTALTRKP